MASDCEDPLVPDVENFDESSDLLGQSVSAFFWIHVSISILLAFSSICVGFYEGLKLGGTAKVALELTAPGIVVSTLLVVVAMIIARKNSLLFQNVAAGGTILLFLVYGALMIRYNYVVTIGMALMSLFFGWLHWRGRALHTISAHFFRAISICADTNPGLYYIPLFGALFIYFYVQFAIFAWKSLLLFIPGSRAEDHYYIACYLVFTIYWTCQVILNTLRSVIAKIYSNFFSTTEDPPSDLMKTVIKETLSHGMDNICVGSVAVLFVSFIHSALRYSLGFLMMRWKSSQPRSFNYFAFNHVTDGRSFPQASRETWDKVKCSGVMDIYTNSNVSGGIFQATTLIAFISAFFTLLVRTLILGAELEKDVMRFFEFCVFSAVIPALFFKILDDGNLSLLVTLAEEPEKVKKRAPRLYAILEKEYPDLHKALV